MTTSHGQCLLCQLDSELQHSHILPAFAYRWLRESSGNGHVRTNREPNKRVQDGPKKYWLCTPCEELFSRSERAFSGKLFYPYLSKSGQIFQYSDWLLHFCTSISWRVLHYFKQETQFADFDQDAISHIDEAESVWRSYLLGKTRNPGSFQQHLLPLDQITSTSGELDPHMNRYLMRAIHMDLCRGDKSIFTYSKIGRFMVIGFIREPNPEGWRGTKVHATQGIIEPRKYVVPRALGGYLNEKAKNIRESLASVSDKQREKINQSFRSNIDRYAESDAFVAFQADVELFGAQAFSQRGEK